MLLSDDMGRTLRVLVLTGFKVLSQAQQLFGGVTEKQENSRIFLSVSWMRFNISIFLATPKMYFQKCGLNQQ